MAENDCGQFRKKPTHETYGRLLTELRHLNGENGDVDS